eukprot:6438112-Lingulodinium_polyedra.AAC.1
MRSTSRAALVGATATSGVSPSSRPPASSRATWPLRSGRKLQPTCDRNVANSPLSTGAKASS